MEQLVAVILAAGEGKRMKSDKSKVVHEVCGKPLIQWATGAALQAGIENRVVVVGHKAEQVKACLGDGVQYVLQEEQLGTGHAVMMAEAFLHGKEGQAIILYGDMPLVRPETIAGVVELHKKQGNAATVITAELLNPSGYGRIVRDGGNHVAKIVEHKDASPMEREIREINTGIYCFNIPELLTALKGLDNNNSQGEYYLTDTFEILIKKGLKVGAMKVEDSNEILGINDRVQLAEAAQVLRKRILEQHMRAGVTIMDPGTTYIDAEVEIGMDTVVYPGTILEGRTVIGRDCILGPNSRIVSSEVGNGSEVNNSAMTKSTVGENTHIGPFAYIRPDSSIGNKVKIGDFVEIKKSRIDDGTKISHLTYVGDAEIGKNVNLGCGVVVVNYDGKNKNKTVVEDNAFIGCNVNLISPVVVKSGAYIAAGSTIVSEVPENALAIARSKQTIKEEWVVKKGLKKKE